jgi:succinate-semialdehyde dehydrogenase/glutarate-semialdehyde dehydrogenase
MHSVNPSTGEVIKEYPRMPVEAALRVLERTARVSAEWRAVSMENRASCLRRAALILKTRSQTFSELMAREMGKPVTEGDAEVHKCAAACEYYAEHAPRFLEPEHVATEATKSYVAFEPLGVVFAIMPFNFPFWQVFRFAAPALMAGNGAVLKHASSVPGCGETLERLFEEAGLPPGLFRNIRVSGEDAGALIDSPAVAAVTLTGSTKAGREVAARAGRALKKSVLELGGSDAYAVLSDADVEHAAARCVKSRLINCGQSCIAAKRFVVVKSLRKEFEERVVELMKKVNQGDPLLASTEIGPMARAELRDTLARQVDESVRAGAELLLGGVVPDRPGAWYPPSVLSDVRPGMPAYDDELFGPVAAILEASSDEEALAIANDTSFGLGAAVFTRDRDRGERIAREVLQAGACFVNALVRSDPRLPFGGIKDSGYGRELGAFGIREFVNIKTVWVE